MSNRINAAAESVHAASVHLPILGAYASPAMVAAGEATLVVVAILGVFLYFLPSIIAIKRHRLSPGMVIVLNIFLGWTFLGWVLSLVMAFGPTKEDFYGNQAGQRVYVIDPSADPDAYLLGLQGHVEATSHL